MNALLFTNEQAAALAAANQYAGGARQIEPRRLTDGRLIVDADVLADPVLGATDGPWRAILEAAQPEILTLEDLAENPA